MISSIIMEVMLIIFSMVITLIAAALTVPAGFGLATMLTPVVLLWLPPHEAIAVVAIIHGAHNAWKLKVLRSSINIDAVKRYGWALILGAIIGSLLQSRIPSNPLLLVVGIALIILPLLSVTEKWTKLRLGETEDRIDGLSAGADDYLPKPFEPRELILRITRILERSMTASAGYSDIIFGNFIFNLEHISTILQVPTILRLMLFIILFM